MELKIFIKHYCLLSFKGENIDLRKLVQCYIGGSVITHVILLFKVESIFYKTEIKSRILTFYATFMYKKLKVFKILCEIYVEILLYLHSTKTFLKLC